MIAIEGLEFESPSAAGLPILLNPYEPPETERRRSIPRKIARSGWLGSLCLAVGSMGLSIAGVLIHSLATGQSFLGSTLLPLSLGVLAFSVGLLLFGVIRISVRTKVANAGKSGLEDPLEDSTSASGNR